jgi:hypothetical protein
VKRRDGKLGWEGEGGKRGMGRRGMGNWKGNTPELEELESRREENLNIRLKEESKGT